MGRWPTMIPKHHLLVGSALSFAFSSTEGSGILPSGRSRIFPSPPQPGSRNDNVTTAVVVRITRSLRSIVGMLLEQRRGGTAGPVKLTIKERELKTAPNVSENSLRFQDNLHENDEDAISEMSRF